MSSGVVPGAARAVEGRAVACWFELKNTGKYVDNGAGGHPGNATEYLKSDVYRLSAKVDGRGWRVEVPNALATAKFGGSKLVHVAVGASKDAAMFATVSLTVRSESDPSVVSTAKCKVVKI